MILFILSNRTGVMGHARYWALLWVMITLLAEMIYLNNKSMSTRLSLHRFNQTLLRARPPTSLPATYPHTTVGPELAARHQRGLDRQLSEDLGSRTSSEPLRRSPRALLEPLCRSCCCPYTRRQGCR
jgi:hypothetical protein